MSEYKIRHFYTPLIKNLEMSQYVEILSAIPTMDEQLYYHVVAKVREVDITRLLEGEYGLVRFRNVTRIYELPDKRVLEFAEYGDKMLRIPLSIDGYPLTLKEYRDVIIGIMRLIEGLGPLRASKWIDEKDHTITLIKYDANAWLEMYITPIDRVEALFKGAYIDFKKEIQQGLQKWREINIYDSILKIRICPREKIVFRKTPSDNITRHLLKTKDKILPIDNTKNAIKHLTSIEFKGKLNIVKLTQLLDIIEDVFIPIIRGYLSVQGGEKHD